MHESEKQIPKDPADRKLMLDCVFIIFPFWGFVVDVVWVLLLLLF